MTGSKLFQLIDFDRTLFDTSAFAKALTDELDRVEPGLGTVLDEQFEAAYRKEQTFFMLRYFRQQKGDIWFEQLVDRVVGKYGAESFMLPGARERLTFAEKLSSEKPSWGILTYGDVIDQQMKLRIAGLQDASVFITDTPDKGRLIATWQLPGGEFQLPDAFGGGVVDALTFEDDKLRAFQGMPAGVYSFWITADKNAQKRIKDESINTVVPVATLYESMELLERQFKAK